MVRPPRPDRRLPVPKYPLAHKVNSLCIPQAPSFVTAPEGKHWTGALNSQFDQIHSHRHIIMGLVLHSWMNTDDDVETNVDALPPPLWFLLYAMQAAHPGLFVIREELETPQEWQAIERGLPPPELLTCRAAGPWFHALLGEEPYLRMIDASLDARNSTKVEHLQMGAFRMRKRAASEASANNGLPPLAPGTKEYKPSTNPFRIRRPSWLSLPRRPSFTRGSSS